MSTRACHGRDHWWWNRHHQYRSRRRLAVEARRWGRTLPPGQFIMNDRTLILSQPGDSHAVAVAAALRRKNHPSEIWYTSDFPGKTTESVRFSRRSTSYEISLPSVDVDDVDIIWNRRPAHVIDQALLDPADHEFAELNSRLFRKSLFDLLCPEAFWVNPHEAVRRLTKLLQAARACEVGLSLPDTLFTNDPSEIRKFLATHSEGVVYKPLSTLPWKDEATYWMPYTAVVREEDLPPDSVLQAVPGIYQALAPKAHELRVTVMGRSVFTAKVLSQQTQSGRLDWRKAYSELKMEEGELPDVVSKSVYRASTKTWSRLRLLRLHSHSGRRARVLGSEPDGAVPFLGTLHGSSATRCLQRLLGESCPRLLLASNESPDPI